MDAANSLIVKFWAFSTPFVLLGSLFGSIVAPTIRSLLFASPFWTTHVKAQVQEAYIMGYFRTGMGHPTSSIGPNSAPTFRDLRYYLVVRYQYRGKTYTTSTPSLYDQDVSLPGHPRYGSDQEYFTAGVERLRQTAPNTVYTFLQSKHSYLDLEEVKQAMAELPAGVANAEMDLPILKWAPGWNYYNTPFTDGIRKGPLIAFIFVFIIGIIPLISTIMLLLSDTPLKETFAECWKGWLVGALIPILVIVYAYTSDRKPPPPKYLKATIPSSQIHRS